MKFTTIACILGLSALASAEVFLEERFNDGDAWSTRWTDSKYSENLGKLAVTAGKWFGDEKESVGLQTSEDYRFYALSTPLQKPFKNSGKNLVLQFNVKHEQKIDCGGGYFKFYPSKFDAETFNGDTEYNIMFGPDICGSKNLVHVIFNYKGKNYNLKETKTVSVPSDVLTHVYTLIVKPDQTYQVLVDGEERAAGLLTEDWDFLPPKTIKDPNSSKPEDWVDEPKITDPEDKKPEGWDDTSEFITDPDAVKPEDWDDDMDGEWEAPSISNPDYQGAWTPKQIDNPAYKGEWVHPDIDNPEYVVDDKIYEYETAFVGIDVWQVKSGSIFDNLLVTDDIEYAEKVRKETWEDLKEKETAAKDAFEEEEHKKVEEEAKSATPEGEEAEEVVGEEVGDEDITVEETEKIVNIEEVVDEKVVDEKVVDEKVVDEKVVDEKVVVEKVVVEKVVVEKEAKPIKDEL